MEIGRLIFPEGPIRGQYKYCIAEKFFMLYFTVINSEDLTYVSLQMFVVINM